MKQTRILLIGDQNAGKTSLINALCNESITTFPTIYQEFRKVQIDKLKILIYDCPGNPSNEYNIQQTAPVAAIAINLEHQNPLLYLEYHHNLVKDKPLIIFIGCKCDKTLHSYNSIKQQISKILNIQNVILLFTSALNQKEIAKFKEDLSQLLYLSGQIFDDDLQSQHRNASYIEEQDQQFLNKWSQFLNCCCMCLKKEE
ncbi:unnamed protein product (macronuclear) [Paramecium tetraurelia]|uniref:G domain-containing protein n=1 Tax=Paramecium tetraurelia TaxID=5888 RepID=A0EG36_PARTE|nr:uncharacterized protein GSPATT00026600001 [Paramecium tetraurelia]CAK94277.1 unnamed protein product [Paramecium tetraurelia]|eukprot:XP_001461650.1 hypothetical protein (macronuclear) [Paramecium tetraurelia strain d4-2]